MIRTLIAVAALLAAAMPAAARKRDTRHDERPATLAPSTQGWNHERRAVDISMRDGVKLHAVILIPAGAKDAPILLTRTPYNPEELTANRHSGTLAAALDGYDNRMAGEAPARIERQGRRARHLH